MLLCFRAVKVSVCSVKTGHKFYDREEHPICHFSSHMVFVQWVTWRQKLRSHNHS